MIFKHTVERKESEAVLIWAIENIATGHRLTVNDGIVVLQVRYPILTLFLIFTVDQQQAT